MQNIRGMLEIIMLFILICKINWGGAVIILLFFISKIDFS